ncbi:heterogeneous nuclear ribonucleoprotein 1-like [Wolffia australiana]
MESDAASSAEPPSSDGGNGVRGHGEGDDGACEQGKLFVGGIPWEATEEALRDYFGKYGQVVEVIVMKDRVTGNPRGFGFVSFVDPSSADMAIQDASAKHSILGRPVDVKRAKPRGNHYQARPGLDGGDEHFPEKSGADGAQFSTKKIFVGGLSANLTKDEFKGYFEKFGAITDVVVMNDNVTHRPRGFGFVTFESEDSVEQAVQQTFQTLNGKTVEVKRAVPKDGAAAAKGLSKVRSGAAYGPLMGNGRGPFYQSYPVGLYSPAGPRIGLYPGGGGGGGAVYPPYGYGPGAFGPGYFYGGYGFGYGAPYAGPGYPPERRSPAGHYAFGVNGDLGNSFEMRTGRGSGASAAASESSAAGETNQTDVDSHVQRVASQLGAASLDDHS